MGRAKFVQQQHASYIEAEAESMPADLLNRVEIAKALDLAHQRFMSGLWTLELKWRERNERIASSLENVK